MSNRKLASFSMVAVLLGCGTGGLSSGSGGGEQGGATVSGADQASTSGATTAVSSSSPASSVSTSGSGGGEEPDFASLPWTTGPATGFGVAFKDSQNHLGNNVFIGYAGYAITLDAAEKWVSALYASSLEGRGVRYVYAVQGPADVTYSQFEIGNSKIAGALESQVTSDSHFVMVAAHSSGAYVAHELLGQLATGLDPNGVTDGKVVYFDLDGGISGLNATLVNRLRRAYFFSAFDPSTNTYSPNHSSMVSGGSTYAQKGGYHQIDASAAGCDAGAVWCLHMTMITTRPHDPTNSDGIPDYSDYAGRPVTKSYIDSESTDAGLDP